MFWQLRSGNLHLINGLFDCHRNRVPVLAIAAQIPSNEIGRGYFRHYLRLEKNWFFTLMRRCCRLSHPLAAAAVVSWCCLWLRGSTGSPKSEESLDISSISTTRRMSTSASNFCSPFRSLRNECCKSSLRSGEYNYRLDSYTSLDRS